jgi:hypothetical protein
MISKLTESPLTLGGGMLCALGLVLLVLGLAFNEDGIKETGLGFVAGGAALIGIFARDNAASAKKAAELSTEIQHTQTALHAVQETVPQVAEHVAKQTVAQTVKEEAQKP